MNKTNVRKKYFGNKYGFARTYFAVAAMIVELRTSARPGHCSN